MKDENDEDEPELQQIGDEDDQADDGPFPDIDTKLVQEENVHRNLNLNLVNEEPCNELPEEKVVSKLAFNPVKTPDEEEDLPEHEVAGNGEEIMEIEFKEEQDVEKCSVDEYEKESKDFEKDKSETSVEAVRDNEVVMVAIDQKMSENLEELTENEHLCQGTEEEDNKCQNESTEDKEAEEANEVDLSVYCVHSPGKVICGDRRGCC